MYGAITLPTPQSAEIRVMASNPLNLANTRWQLLPPSCKKCLVGAAAGEANGLAGQFKMYL
jgi:hypothetical protein